VKDQVERNRPLRLIPVAKAAMPVQAELTDKDGTALLRILI
jgi:hypothetical protein